ncbi:hypothetical protein ALT785_830044 [Alteromonas infernus]
MLSVNEQQVLSASLKNALHLRTESFTSYMPIDLRPTHRFSL